MYLFITEMYLFITEMYLITTEIYLFITEMYIFITKMHLLVPNIPNALIYYRNVYFLIYLLYTIKISLKMLSDTN